MVTFRMEGSFSISLGTSLVQCFYYITKKWINWYTNWIFRYTSPILVLTTHGMIILKIILKTPNNGYDVMMLFKRKNAEGCSVGVVYVVDIGQRKIV